MTVPRITVCRRNVRSTAPVPKSQTDTAACWQPKDRKAAEKLLARYQNVYALDATAHTALLAIGLDMTMRGKTMKAQILRGYEVGK